VHDEVGKVTASVSTTLAGLDEKFARGDDLNAVSLAHDELCKSVASLAPGLSPEQMAELHIKLAGMVAELPEPAAPAFTLAYEEGELTVTMTLGDAPPQVARVPLAAGLAYRGVYRAEHLPTYKAGDFVTQDGSLWACTGVPTEAPGKDFTGWRLAVKCGAAGKSARAIKSYEVHESGRVYRNADFLRHNNRLWQCTAEETKIVPEPGDISSTKEWILIGGVH
jgi:hypothetical protein